VIDGLSTKSEDKAITGYKDLRMLKRYMHLRGEDLALKLGSGRRGNVNVET
jgi:hypothetical protein